MNILLADDHFMVRAGLKLMLNKLADDVTVIEAENYSEALAQIEQHGTFDLIMLDKSMPGMEMHEGLAQIDMTLQPVVILSASENPEHMKLALELGAKGYIPKSSTREIMINALQLVLAQGTYIPAQMLTNMASASKQDIIKKKTTPTAQMTGDTHLTPRQLEVLALIAEGQTNKGIARLLNISTTTVATHVNTIFKALNVNSRTEAVSNAQKQGIIG